MEREALKEEEGGEDDAKMEDGATAGAGSFTVLLGELIVATKAGCCRCRLNPAVRETIILFVRNFGLRN